MHWNYVYTKNGKEISRLLEENCVTNKVINGEWKADCCLYQPEEMMVQICIIFEHWYLRTISPVASQPKTHALYWVWWHMVITPSSKKSEGGRLQFWAQLGQHTKIVPKIQKQKERDRPRQRQSQIKEPFWIGVHKKWNLCLCCLYMAQFTQ